MSSSPSSGRMAALTFEKETLNWRIYTAIIRGAILQFIVILILSAIQSFSPWNPIHWAIFNFNVIFHPSSWFFDALIVASLVALASIYAKQYRLSSAPPKSVASVAQSLLKVEILASLIGHVVAGGVLARCYLGLVGQRQYSTLTLLCADIGRDRCINEPHVFLVVSGCYSGLCIWWDYHMKNGNLLNFPPIQQLGLEQIRGQFSQCFKDSFFQVLLNLRWFYIWYIIFGFKVENGLGDIMHMDLYSQGADSTVSGTVWKHLCVFLQCLTINTLLTLNVSLLRLVIHISLSQRVKFAMKSVKFPPSPRDDCSSVALLDAIGSETELVRYLAYQDFAFMCEGSTMRRADFYALSQPGGHARNWNELVQKCLKLVEDFAKDLNESSKQSIVINPSAAEVAQARRLNNPAIQSATEKAVLPVPAKTVGTETKNPPPSTSVVGKGLVTFYNKISSMIMDKFSVGTSPDASVRSVYAKSMPIIWAIKGLSHLITKSISEDRYGVVQKDLAKILSSFLSLLQTLERHKGLTATARKNRFETKDLQLKQDLRVTLKSALYRICVCFGDHINSLDLPSEHMKRLSNYQTFKEG